MAEKLLQYYKYIQEVNGIEAQIKLAQETKLPSTKAALEPDSPESIRRLREAVRKITGAEAPTF